MKAITDGLIFIIFLTCISCGDNPKVVQPAATHDPAQHSQPSTGIFSSDEHKNVDKTTQPSSDVHTFKVLEVLPTDKYIYMNVEEGEETYWVATIKQEVEVGQKYFYKGGLLKTNFESKEYNRVFDKVYLVSGIFPVDTYQGQSTAHRSDKAQSDPHTETITPKPGSLPISEIVANASKYEGKTIQVTGKCVKLNPNIMGRNWIHLRDGSQDDYDFVLTSDVVVPEGHVVTLSGTMVLDKDFGAGYHYELIVEDAQVVK